jgi:hypothetical protein
MANKSDGCGDSSPQVYDCQEGVNVRYASVLSMTCDRGVLFRVIDKLKHIEHYLRRISTSFAFDQNASEDLAGR